MDLEDVPHYGTVSKQDQLFKYGDTYGALELHGACDSTWASERSQRKSMGGIVLMLAGGAVYYRTHLQPTVALSSTKAEFTTMADAGKAALYIRWIMDEINCAQKQTTTIKVRNEQHLPPEIVKPIPIKADNVGAIKIATAQQPTRRVKHVEMKYFAMLQWTEDKYVEYKYTNSATNYSDSLSKINGSTKHHEHFDISMGRRRPLYAIQLNVSKSTVNKCTLDYIIKMKSLVDKTKEKTTTCSGHSTYSNLDMEKKTVQENFFPDFRFCKCGGGVSEVL